MTPLLKEEPLYILKRALVLGIGNVFPKQIKDFGYRTFQSASYHPASTCWLASEAKIGWSWSVPGWRPDAAGSGVVGPVGGTLSYGRFKNKK